jgi:hypothetical protein
MVGSSTGGGFAPGLPTVLWLYSILTVAGYGWYFRSIRRRFD